MNTLKYDIRVSDELYVRNPDRSKLGQNIISNGIELMHELGFESFTFKKLSVKIGSPESSIYRYFENKHMLLLYLNNWYWSWMEYRIILSVLNIGSPVEKLNKAIEVLLMPVVKDSSISYIDEVLLYKLIVAESGKVMHTKDVDIENKKGFFEAYKYMVNRVASIVLEVNPDCIYPRMLISTIIEGVHQQRYFLEHLPELTDGKQNEDSISIFYKEFLNKMINLNTNKNNN